MSKKLKKSKMTKSPSNSNAGDTTVESTTNWEVFEFNASDNEDDNVYKEKEITPGWLKSVFLLRLRGFRERFHDK